MSSNNANEQQILKDIAIRKQEQEMKDRIIRASQTHIYNSGNIKKP